MRMGSLLFSCLCLGPVLTAQMPPEWNQQGPLGQGQAENRPWYGFGFWAADKHGPAATFVDSLGLGNAITGTGSHLEAGIRTGSWDFAAEALLARDPQGHTSASLYRGHASWRSRDQGGWQLGLEREPLVWGYGLNGGYLLSEAARPFPRLRVESPMAALHIGRVPLGTWGFQAFMGRLATEDGFSDSMQNPLRQAELAKLNGVPQAPFLNGYRIQARFGANLEFYANYINLWAGTLNGKSLTSGYTFSEYLTSMFGLKDTLAEGGIDPNRAEPLVADYQNNARSASNADIGFRLRLRALERTLGSDTAYVYLSRGSKNVWWTPKVFLRNPLHYMFKDISKDAKGIGQGRFVGVWNETGRYSVPNLTSPNDALGVLIAWPGLRIGLEYLDTANSPEEGVRSFTHNLYLSGFYYQGDPLGNAIGGEARTTTARIEADFSPALTGTTQIQVGTRPLREDSPLWYAAHPGQEPVSDRFLGLQQTLACKLSPHATLNLGASYQHRSAVANLVGNRANGFRYFAELGWRWPAPRS